MQFVQFGMLGALGALAIPVIIHLMFRRQARPVDLGTLQFLKVVLRDNARKRRLKRYLLLALRLACVALIALLFARPVPAGRGAGRGRAGWWSSWSTARPAWACGGDPADRPGLGRGPRDRGEGRPGHAAGNRRLRPRRRARSPRPPTPRKAIAGPSAAGTDYDAAMAWARDLCVRSRRPKPRSCTSSPTSSARGWAGARRPGCRPTSTVRLVDLGRAFPKNVAVTGLVGLARQPPPARVGRRLGRRPERLAPAGREGPGPAPPGGRRADAPIDLEQTIDLDGDASATVEFPLARAGRGALARARRGDGRRRPAVRRPPVPRPLRRARRRGSCWSTATRAARRSRPRRTSSRRRCGSPPRGRRTPRPRSTRRTSTSSRPERPARPGEDGGRRPGQRRRPVGRRREGAGRVRRAGRAACWSSPATG